MLMGNLTIKSNPFFKKELFDGNYSTSRNESGTSSMISTVSHSILIIFRWEFFRSVPYILHSSSQACVDGKSYHKKQPLL